MAPDPAKHSRILNHLLDQGPVQVWGVDRDLNLIYMRGGAVERALDEPPEQYLGGPLAAVLGPESQWVLDRHRAAFAGEPQSYEVRWRDRVMWVHLEPPGNGADEVGGIAVDATARVELRDRLEHLFRALGQGVVYQAPTGEITAANEAAQEILGLTMDQMTGRTSMDPEWEAVREDGTPFPGEEHPAMVALREKRVVPGVIMGVSNPHQGHHRWIRVTGVPRLGPDGEPVEVFTSFEDITAIKEAEQEVADRERRFRRLVEHASDGIAVLAPDGTILELTASMRGLLTLGEGHLIGRSFLELVTEEHVAPVRAALRTVADGSRGALGLEIEARGGNGSLTLHLRLSDAMDDPAVGGIVVNARDVSEEQRLLSEVHQLQKMEAVGRLAGGVAHDFNNLLTSILGFAEIMEKVGTEENEEAVQEIIRAGKRGSDLTRQLLQFSRRDSRHPEVFDLGGATFQLERMLRRLLPEDRALTVRAERGAWVRADRGQLEQVVLNLVVNARDATPSGGAIEINVTADEPDGQVSLEVSDTGSGIADEDLAHIFEPFYTTKGPSMGTGLGLSTVLGIVEQNEGTIDVSTELGRGSRFIVRLPQVAPPETGAREAGVYAGPLAQLDGQSVLVVEDDPSVRRLITRTLSGAGLEVTAANDPKEAFVTLSGTDAPDVLISDVVLPGLRGPEFADRILEEYPDVRVILISGYTEEELEDLGHHELLTKPFETDELIETVRRALA